MTQSSPTSVLCISTLLCAFCYGAFCAQTWPELPKANGEAVIPAQDWPWQPGPRQITVHIRYPRGAVEGIRPTTGLMLSLHNWGGREFVGTADPAVLTAQYDVVVIGVDYLQSGPYDPERDPPYDFGWYQALDALRGLYFVWHGLETKGFPFDSSRLYAAGGSGGGNVALMANKLAPRTFACVIDLSGMAKLSDDIAFGLPGRTQLNAGYSRDPQSKRHLTADDQALRFVASPEHAAALKRLGNTAKIIVVHGMKDDACPAEDAKEMVDNLRQAGLDVVPHFITKSDVDGKLFKNCKHSLGDRTRILQHFADTFLLPEDAAAAHRQDKTDFELCDDQVRYETPNGCFIVSYAQGYPVGHFKPSTPNNAQSPPDTARPR